MVDQDARKISRMAVLLSRIVRGRSRFWEVARSDGLRAAMARVARNVRSCLGNAVRPLIWRLGPDRCAYFTPPPKLDPYEAWLRVNRENPRRRRRLAADDKPPSPEPRFSVIVPVYSPPINVFRGMVRSVLDQTVGDWELVLVDDASPDRRVRQELAYWSAKDRRIRVIHRRENGNISAATNDAAAAAWGEFLVLLDHDDLLDRDALAHLAIYLDAHPDTDIVYSDEDQIGADDRPHSPQFKPDWSPELLLSFCYIGHIAAIRRWFYLEAGGMRSGFDGSQDHDFWLRAGERTSRVGHVPQVLYHWRVVADSGAAHSKPPTFEAGRRAVEEAFQRRGVDCRVEQITWAARAGSAIYGPVMPDDGPSVAILIPGHSHWPRLTRAIESLARTTYRNNRIYVLVDESEDPAAIASLHVKTLRIAGRAGTAGLAAVSNMAASLVDEDLLLFLDGDTEVINPRWLSQMVGWLRLKGVGAVGARLLDPDRRVWSAGIVHGVPEGLAGDAFNGLPWWDAGYLNLARVSRNCAAVSAACLLTPRRLFLTLGGFDAGRFAAAYYDADYCHRLRDAGYRSVYCAEATLYRHQSAPRRGPGQPCETAAYRERYGHRVDPYFSPHLASNGEDFQPRPTVVPVGPSSEPVPLLAAMHNLDGESISRIGFELVRRLHATGVVRAKVLSPVDGPLRRAYEELGIPVWVASELTALTGVEISLDRYRAGTARLARWIAGRGYEVVHANGLRCFWAIEAARLAGIASVWSAHEGKRWQTCFDDLPRNVAASALTCLAHPYRVVFPVSGLLRAWSALDSTGNFGLIPYANAVSHITWEMEPTDCTRSALIYQPSDIPALTHEFYRRTILAAAESAPVLPATLDETCLRLRKRPHIRITGRRAARAAAPYWPVAFRSGRWVADV